MKNFTKEDYEAVRPKDWMQEDMQPVDTTQMAAADIATWSVWLRTPYGRKMKREIADKLSTLVGKSGNKPAGSTNVNPMGTNILGPNPKDVHRDDLLTRRAVGEDYNEQAVVAAVNATCKEIGFTKAKDNNYPTQDLAMFAVECDSLSSKGPFDGGNEDTALKVGQDILKEACGDADVPEEIKPVMYSAMNRMSQDFLAVVDPKFKFEPEHYVDHMQARGLSNTMRGYPFLCAGDSQLKDYQFEATKQLFGNVQKLTIHGKDFRWWIAHHQRTKKSFKTNELGQQVLVDVDWYSCDMFIEDIIVELKNLGLKLSQWFRPRQCKIINVSRNQGAGWKIEYNWAKAEFVMGDRKDFKFRYVCPEGAFVQAWDIMASIDLVEKAPATEGRIGLQDPATNDKRFDDFLTRTEQRNKFIVSTDFTAYDTTLATWLMNSQGLSWAVCYEDEFVRDALAMAGITCATKFMIIPTYPEMSKNYGMKNALYWDAKFIKGSRQYIANHTKAGVKNRKLKRDIESLKDKFDWQCRIVYNYKKYLKSGSIFTNTIGSCCTLTMGRTYVPYLLHKMRKGEISWKTKK